jgi:phage terminase large subunit
MEINFKTKIQNQVTASKYWVDDVTEQILYGGAKGGGKTVLGCSLIFGDALIYPDTHYFIARQELNDLRKFIIPSVAEWFEIVGLKMEDYATFNGQDNYYSLYNGSRVYLISCKEIPSDPLYERFGAMQNTRGWIEEAGEVCEAAKDNLWLSVGRWKNDIYGLKKKLLLTANPKKGWMKRDFVDPLKENRLPISKQYVQSFATDNTYLSADYIKSLQEDKNKVRRQRLSQGNWDYDEDMDSLTTFDALSDAFTNTITKDNEKYLTIDVARLGKDSTVFGFWNGLELYRIEKFNKQDTEKTKQTAKDYAITEKIPYSHIVIDEDGIGGAVVDGMVGVRGFVANSTPLPTRSQIRGRISKLENPLIPKTSYGNLKSQCAFKLAELINEHKITFKVSDYREQIIEELTSLLRQKDVDTDGKLLIRPKDSVKEDIGRSPDIGDSIIFRAWFELSKDATNESPERTRAVAKQTDQFNRNQFNQGINSAK